MKNNFKSLFILAMAGLLTLSAAAGEKGKKQNATAKAKTLRVMDYNIADGMWYDQFDNYDRFVEWMKGQDADVLAVCEGATHWDRDKKNVPREPQYRYLPDSLSVLAARWGHPYTVVGPYQDNYPVAFTSKYPIELVQRIGEGLSHGALHVRIKGVNYVVLHLWPQRYSMGDKTKSDNKGEAFRVEEMTRILDATIRNPKFAAEKHWMMMGDFNSHSPVDSAYHGKRNYDLHNLVRSVYARDAVGDFHAGKFIPSTTGGKARIDYIYCTEELYKLILTAESPRDAFAGVASDHLPVVVELKMPKECKK